MDIDDLQQKLRQSEALTAYLRSTIDEKDERLARAEHQLQELRNKQISEINNLSYNFEQQIMVLKGEVTAFQIEISTKSEEVATLLIFRRENEILKQQISTLRDEQITLRKSHKISIQQTRDEVTQIRAGLAAEFQLQLENTIENNVDKELRKLPDKARCALAEKEVLRLQLRSQDEELWKNLEFGMKAEKRIKELELDAEINREEVMQLGKRNMILKKKNLELERKIIDQDKALKDNDDELVLLRQWKVQYLEWKSQINQQESEAVGVRKQLQYAMLGLKRVCARYKLDMGQFYRDPLEDVKLKEKLPSIIAQKGRFIVPDI
ncbi:hypothetical protein SS50377_23831 [Spironucleus salmonicida]|uniref:Uncharacterized protein n=1 Tax=Spironucleus salmonicida TaxID=348837 RepID=V6LIJ1_9EUKA|nr:hypothetical protein SS50377_23831 [Spironucleus salmonicida]|eukprot:EST44133.1 hypothetical protein SS50377_16034 [Spironucleus salmonicida]